LVLVKVYFTGLTGYGVPETSRCEVVMSGNAGSACKRGWGSWGRPWEWRRNIEILGRRHVLILDPPG
jgi:hypothetical protein